MDYYTLDLIRLEAGTSKYSTFHDSAIIEIGMDYLPQDNLLLIFKDLNIFQIINLQKSCKRFKVLIDQHHHLWRNLCIKDYPFLFSYPYNPSVSSTSPLVSQSSISSLLPVPEPSRRSQYDWFFSSPTNFKELYVHEHKIRYKWWFRQALRKYNYYYPWVRELDFLFMAIGPFLSLFWELSPFSWMVLQLIFNSLSLSWTFKRIEFHVKLSYRVNFSASFPPYYKLGWKPQYFYMFQYLSLFHYLVLASTALLIFIYTFPNVPIFVPVIISFVPYLLYEQRFIIPVPRMIIPILFQIYVGMTTDEYISLYLLLSWKKYWTLIILPLSFLVLLLLTSRTNFGPDKISKDPKCPLPYWTILKSIVVPYLVVFHLIDDIFNNPLSLVRFSLFISVFLMCNYNVGVSAVYQYLPLDYRWWYIAAAMPVGSAFLVFCHILPLIPAIYMVESVVAFLFIATACGVATVHSIRDFIDDITPSQPTYKYL